MPPAAWSFNRHCTTTPSNGAATVPPATALFVNVPAPHVATEAAAVSGLPTVGAAPEAVGIASAAAATAIAGSRERPCRIARQYRRRRSAKATVDGCLTGASPVQ